MEETTVRQLYKKVDTLDASAFAEAFVEDGTVTFGNQPPAKGRRAIRDALQGFFSLLDGMHHEFLAMWRVPEGWVLEATVAYRVRGVAKPIEVSGATVLRLRGDALFDVRIYYDLAPVVAAAQATRVPEQVAADLPVHHREGGDRRGAFVIDVDGARAAELTYTMNASTVVLERTWVSDSLRGRGVARRLLTALVAWVRESKIHVVALCPLAGAEIAKDPTLRDVLSPR